MGSVCKTLAGLKPFMKVLNLQQRRQIVYQKALSILEYGLPLYVGQCKFIKDRVSTLYMRANRLIYHDPLPLKTKNKWICRKVGVKMLRQIILQAGAKIINSIVNTGRP